MTSKRFIFTMPEEEKKELKNLAKHKHVSQAKIVRNIIMRYIKKQKKQQSKKGE